VTVHDVDGSGDERLGRLAFEVVLMMKYVFASGCAKASVRIGTQTRVLLANHAIDRELPKSVHDAGRTPIVGNDRLKVGICRAFVQRVNRAR
jgi:hypothetical protein